MTKRFLKSIPFPAAPHIREHVFISRGHSSGLTLLEVTISMSLVTLLAAVTYFPVKSFEQKGRLVECRNNLRQVAMGFHIYITDNMGHAPATNPDRAMGKRRRRRASRRHFLRGSTHNYLGFYTSRTGFRAQGLGRLLAGDYVEPGTLYCPSDSVLRVNSEITSAALPNDPWLLRYPLQTSYLLRPSGQTVPWERSSALADPFDSNPGTKVLITEISQNHTSGVHVALINGTVLFVKAATIPATAFSAIGVARQPVHRVTQESYRFLFPRAPWIWIALDDPKAFEKIRQEHPPLNDLDDYDDDSGSDDPGGDADDDENEEETGEDDSSEDDDSAEDGHSGQEDETEDEHDNEDQGDHGDASDHDSRDHGERDEDSHERRGRKHR